MEAPAAVQGMFARIAGRYDLVNALLSGGLDFFWRRRAARLCAAGERNGYWTWPPAAACWRRAWRVRARRCASSARISVYPCSSARRRPDGWSGWSSRTGCNYPFADAGFDALTVAFGLRNMADYAGALREMRRVLRPGGKLLVLDFSVPRGWWRGVYRFYLHRCLPTVAGIVSGERAALRVSGGIHRTISARGNDARAVGRMWVRRDDRRGIDRRDCHALHGDGGGGYSIQLRKL